MSQSPPNSLEVSNIQFKLQNQIKITSEIPVQYQERDLVATASGYNLIFVGCLTPAELRVIRLCNIVEKSSETTVRSIQLPGVPLGIALSCDNSLLAVSVFQSNAYIIIIYKVLSFLSTNICEILRIPFNIKPIQLLWNPVIPNTMAVCYENGNLSVYNIKENANLEFFSIDKTEYAQCASWSPKGKQIVIAFPNGKLAQYKPDLKLARTIPCLVNLFPMQFDSLAVQWLSTYQFAAVFLPRDANACPALHIINAPKNQPSSYINYEDICYGQSGPRKHQIYLQHILQWNLLIVASSNSIETAMLGTTETGETPKWQQYTMLDECRAELPLTSDTKQEAYPVGMAIESGCTHFLTINENQLPIPMPMIHLITTTGYLVSFNLLNLRPNVESICSPPMTVNDVSGLNQFRQLPMTPQQHSTVTKTTPDQPQIGFDADRGGGGGSAFDLSVNSGRITSTPTAPSKQTSFFATPPTTNEPSTKVVSNLFGQTSSTNVVTPPNSGITSGIPFGGGIPAPAVNSNNFSFSLGGANMAKPNDQQQTWANSGLFGNNQTQVTSSTESGSLFGGSAQKSLFTSSSTSAVPASFSINANVQQQQQQPSKSQSPQATVVSSVSKTVAEPPKPFVTVNPVYTAPSDGHKPISSSDYTQINQTPVQSDIDDDETNQIIFKYIGEEIRSFEQHLAKLRQRSIGIDIKIGTKDEIRVAHKQLNELQDIVDQAVESTDTLAIEIQSLKLSFEEAYSMAMEATTKQIANKNSDFSKMQVNVGMSQTNRRQLQKLQNLLAVNENQFQLVTKQIDAQWSTYQSLLKQNSKNKMHMPTLENVYQTLSKQRDILNRQKFKINLMKSKLGLREDHTKKTLQRSDITSLADSMYSLSLADQIIAETDKLSTEKLDSLRNLLKGRQTVMLTKSKRTSHKGLNSEVVVEKLLANAKAQKLKKPTADKSTVKEKALPGMKSISIVSTDKPKLTATTKQMQPQQLSSSSTKSAFGSIGSGMPAFTPMPTGFGGSISTETTKPISITEKSKLPEDLVINPLAIAQKSTTALSSSASSPAFSFTKSNANAEIKSILSQSTTKLDANPSSNSSIFGGQTAAFKLLSSSSFPAFGGSTGASQPMAKPIPVSIPFGGTNVAAVTTSMAFGGNNSNASNMTSGPLSFGLSATDSTKSDSIDKPTPLMAKSNVTSDAVKTTTTPPPLTITTKPKNKENVPSAVQQQQSTTKSILDNVIETAIKSPTPLTPLNKSPAQTQQLPFLSSSGFDKAPANVTVSNSSTSGFTFSLNAALPTTAAATTVAISSAVVSQPSAPVKPTMTTTTALLSTVTTTAIATTASLPTTNSTSSSSFSFASTFGAGVQNTATSGADSVFQGLNICKPTTAPPSTTIGNEHIFAMPSFSSPNSTDQSKSIFGTNTSQSPFAANAAAAIPATSPTTATTLQSSPFGGAFATNATTATPPAKSLFGGGTTTSATGDQSVFGSSFSALQSPNNPAFGSPFGGGQPDAAATASTTATSPFGGSGTSLFGNGTSSFGQPASGGSLFGQTSGATSFGGSGGVSSGSSIFGGGSAVTNQPAAGAGASSIFGGSTFGGFGQQQPSAFGGGGGPFSGGNSGGSFLQGGPSISQTGFGGGNPITQQQPSAFQPATAAIGSSSGPMFGATPAFGGAATFGTPKTGFGVFANVQASPPSGSTGGNSLFESLGASENAMTFGNIAHQAAPIAPKPAFGGGSSFSSWR